MVTQEPKELARFKRRELAKLRAHQEALSIAKEKLPFSLGLERTAERDISQYQHIPQIPPNASGEDWRKHMNAVRGNQALLADRLNQVDSLMFDTQKIFLEWVSMLESITSDIVTMVAEAVDPGDEDDDDDDDEAAETDQPTISEEQPGLARSTRPF